MREGESRKSRRLAQPRKVPLLLVPWNDRKAKPKKNTKKGLTRNNIYATISLENRSGKDIKCMRFCS